VVFLAVTEWELPEVGARSRTARTSVAVFDRTEFASESERPLQVDDPFLDLEPELVVSEPVLAERPEEPVVPGLTFEDLWPSVPKTDLLTGLEPEPPAVEPEGAPEAEEADAEPQEFSPDTSAETLAAVELDNPPPTYPRASQRLREEGEVLLALTISAAGRVVEARVVESSGHSRLDRAAREAVERWTFAPATRGGVAVEWVIEHRVVFRLD